MASTIVELTDIFSHTVCSVANETILTNAVTLENEVKIHLKMDAEVLTINYVILQLDFNQTMPNL